MLNDATGFSKIMIAAGYTDLRRGIEGLATIIRYKYKLDPYGVAKLIADDMIYYLEEMIVDRYK